MNLSIIIPLYNEENTIIPVLDKILNITYPPFLKSLEILVIDDCSTDNSYVAVSEHINDKPEVRLIQLKKNKGKGAVVHKGFELATGDAFLIQDADLELDPSDIPGLLQAMHELNIEFINGSRYLPGVIRPLYSYKKYLANKMYTFLTSLLINVKLTDMACGYKLIHKNLLSRIKLKEKGFGFEAELIIKALRIKKNNIAEIPVKYFPRDKGGGKKMRNIYAFRILWTIIKYALLRLK